jgi:hypothetical protein
MPDCLWPSSNKYGIPSLLLNMQADTVDLPVLCWGSISRKTRMRGTWHFYTDDYRYDAVWRNPDQILLTNCINAVEPNYSCYQQTPPAVVIWNTYKKRWLARYWQSQGVKIFVDLNVSRQHVEDNLLGIPQGWRSFATRGYNERMQSTLYEFKIARQIAGKSDILFVVYGGNEQVHELCMQHDWIWIPEQEDTKPKQNKPVNTQMGIMI